MQIINNHVCVLRRCPASMRSITHFNYVSIFTLILPQDIIVTLNFDFGII